MAIITAMVRFSRSSRRFTLGMPSILSSRRVKNATPKSGGALWGNKSPRLCNNHCRVSIFSSQEGMMTDQQDNKLYDVDKMRVMQEKIHKKNIKRGNPGCALFLMVVAAVFIGAMVTTIFPRMMLPIGGFLVCPPDSELDVTLGEKERYINAEGDVQFNTPIYMNCMRGDTTVKTLTDGAMMLIILFYTAGLLALMLVAYVIIRIYKRKNAELFEMPPPFIPPPK
jgi:hypothetical protein